MPSAKILFIIPKANRIDDLIDLIEESHGEFDDWPADEINEGLHANIGKPTSVEFHDADDPIETIAYVVEHLYVSETPFFAITDSFTEPARGLRCEGTVTLFMNDKKLRVSTPWVEGEPELNERTLQSAGIAEDIIVQMVETFYPDAPKPKF